jgi:hypothetical protein
MGPECRTCCLPDATCVLATPAQCAALFGISGTGQDCSRARCPDVIGALQSCCLPDGSCRDIGAIQCGQMGGIPQGPGSTCATTNCPPPPTRACCLFTGGCDELTQAACLPIGNWLPTAHCSENPCPLPGEGACCLGDLCQQMSEAACATNNGRWQGLVLCSPGLCTCTGACCRTREGVPQCQPETEANCRLSYHGVPPGIWLGCGVGCEACIHPSGLVVPGPRRIVVPGTGGCAGCGSDTVRL